MSRRASLLAKEQKTRAKVRFPDELVFLDNIKEGDVPAMQSMLRRVSVSININAVGSSGMTPLHQAVMEENAQAVRLLTRHGCDIDTKDIDSWTALHAACANGFSDIVKVLLEAGADAHILTEDGERPYDLIEPHDLDTVGVMLSFRTMREGVEEEDEEESDEEESDAENGDVEEDVNNNNESNDEDDEEIEAHGEVNGNDDENDEEEEEEEEVYEQDSLEADEDNDSICGGNDQQNEQQTDSTVLNGGDSDTSFQLTKRKPADPTEDTFQLGSGKKKQPESEPKVIKSILKRSDRPKKTLNFEA